jgi:acyl dehydratase
VLHQPSHRLDAAEIKAFTQEFDPQPFHLSEEGRRSELVAALVASGWHTAALTMRLLVQGGLPIAGGVIGAGGELSWPMPTRPGDTLTVFSEVLEITPSRSRPQRGSVRVRCETRNQHGKVVQLFTPHIIVPRRPAALAGSANSSGT